MRGAALALALALTACSRGSEASSAASQARSDQAQVAGTVVDAATRQPVPGASVRGPGGTRARTDARGRFRLEGLAAGQEGELVAVGPEGGEGRIPLLPLRPGTLEVVVHLRTP